MKTNPPSIESAAATARTISRRLRAAGIPMSRPTGEARKGRGLYEEGVHVHRVGYSSLVTVGYWIRRYVPNDEEKARRAEVMAKVRELLTGMGYSPEAPRGLRENHFYIQCLSA